MNEIFKMVDALNLAWVKLEDTLGPRFKIKENGINLAIERYKGVMRLCYLGRPVMEGTVDERIAAAHELEKFLIYRQRILTELPQEIAIALNMVEDTIKDLEKK